MSTNYGRSRKSQMLLGLLLQFSEFLLFQVPRKKKRRHKIKKKKNGRNGFPASGLAAAAGPSYYVV
jgi:hypothetical protein